jgi:hypothetical protein
LSWAGNEQPAREVSIRQADSGVETFKILTRVDDVVGQFSADGHSLFIFSRRMDDEGMYWQTSPLECWDVPARKPWCWIVCPPLVLLGMALGLGFWKRKGTPKPSGR